LPAQLAERADLIAAQRMDAWLAVLDPANVERRVPTQLDLRPFEIGDLCRP
jgi:hypothetical protein